MSGKVVPATNIYLKAAPGDSNNSIFQVFGTPTGNNLTGLVGSNYDDGARPPPYTALTVPNAASGNLKLSFFGGKSVFLGAPTTLDILSFNVSSNKLTTNVSGGGGTSFRVLVGTTDKGSNVLNNVASGADLGSLITLVSNTYYYISAYGSNATDQTASLLVSNTSRFTSDKAPAPTDVSASAVSVNGLTPTWTDPVGNATLGYKIRIGTGNSGPSSYNIIDGSAVIKESDNLYTISSNVYVYVSIAVSNAKGVGTYGTGTTSYLTSKPELAPTVTPTAGTTTKITATIAQASAENGTASFLAKCGTTTAADELVGTAATITSGTAFPSAGFTAQPSNNLIYLKVASSNSLGVGAYSTAVSFPSTVPPAPTVSGISATATTITATLSVSGNAPTTYKVILGDATTNSTTLSNVTGPTDISSGSAATVGWGGSNKCYYATFIGSNAAGLGAFSTSTFLANWNPSVSVSFSSVAQDGSSVAFSFVDQPTTNGLTYTDIRLGTTAGAADIRAAQALTAGIQAGTQTFSISATARPYTVYITATAAAGSTKTSTGSSSYTILGYPLYVSNFQTGVDNLSGYTGTNTSLSFSSYTRVSASGIDLKSASLVASVSKTGVYHIYSFKMGYTVSSLPGESSTPYYSNTIYTVNNSLITAYAGGRIYVSVANVYLPQTTSGVAMAIDTSTGNLPIGGTISIPDPIAVWPSTTVTGGWRVHVFTSSGNFVPQMGGTGSYNIVVIGGGGGAGCGINGRNGGGGGAGGVVIVSNAVLENTGTFPITIGAGGAGSGSTTNTGGTGSNSTFSTGGSFVITAYGGSGGGSFAAYAPNSTGSGGGGANSASELYRYGGTAGTAGTVVYAPSGSSSNFYTNAGGTGVAGSEGGGGGGAAGAGGTSTADQFGSSGGGGAGATFFGTIYAAGGGAWGYVNGPGCGGTSGWGGGGGGYSGAVIIYYRI